MPGAVRLTRRLLARVALACLVLSPVLVRADEAANPAPVLIELHPPFKGRYWGLGQTKDGDLLVGAEENIGVFDGLRWRRIAMPRNTAGCFLAKGDRVWVAGNGEIGWFSLNSAQNTYHRLPLTIEGEVFYLFDCDDGFVAVSYDNVLLLSARGELLRNVPLPRPTVRLKSPWRDGWIIRSSQDAFFIRTHGGFEVTDKLPIPARTVYGDRLVGVIPTGNTLFLPCVVGPYELKNGTLTRLHLANWENLASEHVISVFQNVADPTLIRASGDDGLEGFDPASKELLWHLEIGKQFIGDLGTYPLATRLGLFFGTSDRLYWMLPPALVRTLVDNQQQANGVSPAADGFWVCTSVGSWRVPNGNWSALDYRPGVTDVVAETPAGVIRGLSNLLDINSRSFPLSATSGQVNSVAADGDDIVVDHANTLLRYDHSMKLVNSVDVPDTCTTMTALPSGDVFIGTSHQGVWKWNRAGTLTNFAKRGTARANVARKGSDLIVLWSDGTLQIGADTVQLPNASAVLWSALTATDQRIIIGGRYEDTAALVAVERRNGEWYVRTLDHKILDTVGGIEQLSLSGDRLGIMGSGRCIDVALSVFNETPHPPQPHISFPRAFVSDRGAASLRDVTFDRSERLQLNPDEDELRFVLKGGPEDWQQRLKFFYRMTPDSADWTDLDPANEITLQRIGVGRHVLEIQGRTLTGTATSQFAIIRAPHWYASPSAYSVYVLSFLGMAAGFTVWRTRRLEQRAKALEERVAKRTAELKITNEALKKANEAKDEFLASMSHEIRNPLNGVIGLSSMLRASVDKERDRRLADSLQACADQLRLVLDDVLDFAAIEHGDVSLHVAPFHPASAVEAAVTAIDAHRERSSVAFIAGITSETVLNGDEGKVRQIVSNLVSNALKYGVPSEANVLVAYGDGALSISVSNTGPDIPESDRQRIFGSFERGRSLSHRHARGAGLGLTISARFAQAMGGTVSVESANGLTAFTFTAPLPEAAVKLPVTAAKPVVHRGSALAIEDENYNRLVLGDVLGGLGYLVEWAQNGATALEIIRSGRRVDVVLTDWMLPDIDGAKLVGEIKRLCGANSPPIIAITAYATAEKRAEAFNAGVTAFVTKPIQREKIEAALQGFPEPQSHATTDGEPLRLSVLLDAECPRARTLSFQSELQMQMTEIDRGLADRNADTVARSAHQLASQVLAIHHHTLADELRTLEALAGNGDWDGMIQLHGRITEMADVLIAALTKLAAEKTASEPTPETTT